MVKNKLKQKLFFLNGILVIFLSVFVTAVSTNEIYADNSYLPCTSSSCTEMYFTAVRCDATRYNNFANITDVESCMSDYLDGQLSGYELANGAQADAGSYILFVMNIRGDVGNATNMIGMNTRVQFDTNVFSYVATKKITGTGARQKITDVPQADVFVSTELPPYDTSGTQYGHTFTYNTGLFTWQLDGASQGDEIFAGDPPSRFGGVLLKVADTLNTDQTTLSFVDNNPGNTQLTDADSQPLPHNSTNFVVNFQSAAKSEDATLGSLSVTKTDGSTTYPLDPAFSQSAAAQTVFSTKVPSGVSQIKINATAHHDKAQDIRVFDGNVTATDTGGTSIADTTVTPIVGVGTKSLGYGANEFTIAVTSENGNVQNEVVSVYRLSSDATLNNLAVTGYNFDNNASFSPSTTSYAISNIPYATKSVEIVGAVNDTGKATADNLGAWSFPSDPTAAQTFSRKITVTPEECNYTSGANAVQGASCNKKEYTITFNRNAASTDANLKLLDASYLHLNGSTSTDHLVPSSQVGQTFDLGDVPYDTSTITITATANQNDARKITLKQNSQSEIQINTSGKPISGTETCNLQVGDNTCVIKVTAEDNSHTQTYTITAHRRSNDATLKSLSVSANPSVGNLQPSFNKTSPTRTYEYYYSEKASTIDIAAEVNDADKTQSVVLTRGSDQATSTGNTVSKSLTPNGKKYNEGGDTATIVVTSENGDIDTYTVKLYRQASSDTSLSSLVVKTSNGTTTNTHTIPLVANTFSYNVEVDADVDTITEVTATATSAYASVDPSDITYDSSLDFGNGNEVKVKVTPESGNKTEYTVKINRKKYAIAGLTAIRVRYGSEASWTTVDGVSANTDGTFNLRVKDVNPVEFGVETMEIEVDKANQYETVDGDGSKTLVAAKDNVFVITAKSQDNQTTRTYTLHVYEDGNPDTSLSSLMVKGVYPSKVSGSDTEYTMNVPYSVTEIKESDVQVVTNDQFATVAKSGTISLTLPTTEDTITDYPFTVTSQSGAQKTYTVHIKRLRNDQSGATNVKLQLSDESEQSVSRVWNPASGESAHTFYIPYNKSQYYLRAAIPDGAYIYHDLDNGYVDSDDLLTIDAGGTSTHKIKIISQDGSANTEYAITVIREQSTDTTLDDLNISYVSGDTAVVKQTVTGFSTSKSSYNIEVPGDVTHITIGAVLHDKRGKFAETDSNADYEDTFSLSYGSGNSFDFDVIAEKGDRRTYTVNVTRPYKTNPYIQSITINDTPLNDLLVSGSYCGYEYTTNTSCYDYTLKNFTNDIGSITIKAVMVDAPDASQPGAKAVLASNNQELPQSVAIKTIHYGGAANLENVIKIKGIAHDGTTFKDYTLRVYRDPSNDSSISNDADAVQMKWDGTWHNASWNHSKGVYEITVPNSVDTVKGGADGNIQVKPKAAPENGAAGTVVYDPEKTLVTNDETTGNVNSYDFKIFAENGVDKSTYTIEITKEKSDNALLSSLSVNDDRGNGIGSFKPSFEPGKFEYEVTVGKDVSEVWLAATNNHHATITGLGKKTVDGVDDVFEIVVTPENSDTTKKKTYTVTIVREKSDDATLSAFSVTNLNDEAYEMVPPFQTGVSNITYEVTIPGDQEKVKLVYAGSDQLAEGVSQTITYTEAPDSGTENTFSIPSGDNRTIGVRVLAENGSTEKTYNVKVIRTPRSVAALDILTYSYSDGTSGSLLDSCVLGENGYICDLGQLTSKGPTTVTFGGHATDSQATISGTGEAKGITTGRNSYQIVVTAEDETTTQTYNVSLIKKPSEDALLTNITVPSGTNFEPSFASGTYKYAVKMDEEKKTFSSSDLTVTRSVNSSTITFGEPINLTAGADNWYSMVVTPEACKDEYADLVEDGIVNCTDNIKTYQINVKRPYSTNSYLYSVDVDDFNNPEVDQETPSRLGGNFDRLTSNYTITIPYGDNNFYIRAEPEKDVSVVSDNNGCVFTAENDYTCRVYENDLTNGDYRITVMPQSGENPRTYYFAVSIAKSSDNTLASLVVLKDGATVELTPTFDPAKTSYVIPDITNDVAELIVQAMENNSNATYRYIYQNNLVCGETGSCKITIDPSKPAQTIKVEVTPADYPITNKNTYRIDFNIKKDSDADLASLTVDAPGQLNKNFVADETNYQVTGLTYENVTGPVALKFKTSDPDALISINGGDDLVSGSSEWSTNLYFTPSDKNALTITTTIKVTAEDNTTKTYTIVATRAAALASTDATLKSLSVTGETLDPDFVSDGISYDLGEINYQKRSIELVMEPNNEEASIFVNGNEVEINGGVATVSVNAPLTNEEQTVTIRVLAGDKVTDKEYTVRFHKVGNDDVTLSSLSFTNGTLSPDFAPGEKSYTLTLSEGQQTEITAVPAGVNATMTFGTQNNAKNLESGKSTAVTGLTDSTNVRYLTVIAEDGSSNMITITIVRASGDDIITSLEYGHQIDSKYILSVADYSVLQDMDGDGVAEYPESCTMTLGTLKNQLDNNNANLHGYRISGTTETELSDSDIIGTGVVIRLISNDSVLKDSKTVIIKGDVDGDGCVDMIDYGLVRNHYSEAALITDEAKLVAGDVDSSAVSREDISDEVDMIDYGIIRNHYAENSFIDYSAMLNPSGGAPPGS